MRNKIKQILKESEDLEWAQSTVSNQELPFKITGPIKPPPPRRNLFVVRTRWMSGDADSYNDDTEHYNVDNPQEFEWFVDLCRVYSKIEDGGYSDWDDLNKILNPIGYYVRGYSMSKPKPSGTEVTDLIFRDVFSDGQYPAQLNDINILYYDANGIGHNVELQ